MLQHTNTHTTRYCCSVYIRGPAEKVGVGAPGYVHLTFFLSGTGARCTHESRVRRLLGRTSRRCTAFKGRSRLAMILPATYSSVDSAGSMWPLDGNERCECYARWDCASNASTLHFSEIGHSQKHFFSPSEHLLLCNVV